MGVGRVVPQGAVGVALQPLARHPPHIPLPQSLKICGFAPKSTKGQ